jgi:hypothetical protein
VGGPGAKRFCVGEDVGVEVTRTYGLLPGCNFPTLPQWDGTLGRGKQFIIFPNTFPALTMCQDPGTWGEKKVGRVPACSCVLVGGAACNSNGQMSLWLSLQ